MYASQKVQVFSSFCRKETDFFNQQGHQRACELTQLITILQNTIITVSEVEHLKTVNTKKVQTRLFDFQN